MRKILLTGCALCGLLVASPVVSTIRARAPLRAIVEMFGIPEAEAQQPGCTTLSLTTGCYIWPQAVLAIPTTLPAGTTLSPAIAWATAPTTGIYLDTLDGGIGFSVGGVSRGEFTTAGMTVNGAVTFSSLTVATLTVSTAMQLGGSVTGGSFSSATLTSPVVNGVISSNGVGGMLIAQSAATVAGNGVSLTAGTAGAGTNLNGGSVTISAGGATGTGTGGISFLASGGGTTGTGTNAPALVAGFAYPQISLYSHLAVVTGSGTPTAGTCGGTGTISGFDNDFDVTVGGTSTTTCTITFGHTFNSAPHVGLGLHTPAAGNAYATTISSTGMVITFATATTNGIVSVVAIPST